MRVLQTAARRYLGCTRRHANSIALLRWRSSNTASSPLCVRVWVNFVITFFLFFLSETKSARNEEPSSRGALNSGLASGDSGPQVNLEIALSGVSAKVKPLNRFFSPAESALRRRMT